MKRHLIGAALAAAIFQCHSYRPLEAADECACKPSEYCKVSPGARECVALPQACGAHPTCDCIGNRSDSCRDEDGRLTLLPPRTVAACDACSAEEYCTESASGAACSVLPPKCDSAKTCACFMETRGHKGDLACAEKNGRIVARLVAP